MFPIMSASPIIMLVSSIFIGALVSWCWLRRDPLARYPLINGRRRGEFTYSQSKARFITDASTLLKEGLATSHNAFRLVSDNRTLLVLRSKYREELRDHKHLDNAKPPEEDFFGHLSGFEPFNHSKTKPQIFAAMVRTKLTPAIGTVIESLSEEADAALQDELPYTEWQEITVKQLCLDIVARLSTRVFLGPQFSRNRAWVRLSIDYTVNAFIAAMALRPWPQGLRWLVQWLLPTTRIVRAQVQEARALISASLREGKSTRAEEYNTPRWLEECAQGEYYDPVLLQIGLAVVATHTSADLLCQVILDLAQRPELIEEVRQEVVSVVQTHGWTKQALYNLKLMDSVMKESQRLKPLQIVSMYRRVTENITLSDGTFLPKGATIAMVDDHSIDLCSDFSDGDCYDGRRFLRLRQTDGQANHGQLVSLSAQQTGFGYGRHACPGRFFAAAELKVVLCHLLLRYEFTACGPEPTVSKFGFGLSSDASARITVRWRQ